MATSAPLARQDSLVIEQINNELLTYDPETHNSACLNEVATQVWLRCDGKATAAEIAERIRRETNVPVDVSQVWYTLDLLGKNHLLQERVPVPPEYARLTRRDLLRKAGVAGAAVAIPVIISLAAPTPAMAQTPNCNVTPLPNGCSCTQNNQCQSNHCCNPLNICNPTQNC